MINQIATFVTCNTHALIMQNVKFTSVDVHLQIVNWKMVQYLELQIRGGTVKILKIGTSEIITIIVLQLEQLDFTVQYCVQKMQTE